jgi:hypothetical protein
MKKPNQEKKKLGQEKKKLGHTCQRDSIPVWNEPCN